MRKFCFLFIFISIFNLIFSKNIIFNFNVPKGKIEYFKAGDIYTQTQEFYEGNIELELEEEEYYFLFTSKDYSSIQKIINFKEENGPIQMEFKKNEAAIIKGKVKCNDTLLGDVTISFIDAKNHSFNFSSDLFGNFTAQIPPGNYKVNAVKNGFILKESENIIYDFTSKNNNYNIELTLEELPSFIRGQVIDEKGLAISNPQLSIKNGSNITRITGDNSGFFSLPVESGIVTILAEKDGYLQNGVVRKIERNSSIINIEIPLTQNRFSITGTVIDDVKALLGVQLQLMTEDYDKITTTTTNENGFFEFYKIPGNQKVFILISEKNKPIKKSNLIDLNKDIRNFNILLN